MRNRILSLTRSTIPYVKELMPLAHSLAGCILMQQLDYWFERKPNGFYKFLESCPHQLYRLGESWVEELGISAVEFRTTFDRFATRYKSKSEFDRAPDKFQGKFYCSYHDKRAQLTWYFRNHTMLDQALDDLLMVKIPAETPQNGGQNSSFPPNFPVTPTTAPTGYSLPALPVTTPSVVTGSAAQAYPINEVGEALRTTLTTAPINSFASAPRAALNLVHEPQPAQLMELSQLQSGITKTTADFQRPQPQTANELGLDGVDGGEDRESRGGSGLDLIFPSKASSQERVVLTDLLAGCAKTYRQAVLDELEGYIRADKITAGIIPLARSLVRAVGDGKFAPNYGVAVLGDRETKERHLAAIAMTASPSTFSEAAGEINPLGLALLPPAMRKRAEASLMKREER